MLLPKSSRICITSLLRFWRKGIGRQLKQGLYREYLNRKEDVAVVRGKIDMPGTIQNQLARKRVLSCEYDELSENNLLNQILKTTVMLLLRHTRVDQVYKSDLKRKCCSSRMLIQSTLPRSAGQPFVSEEQQYLSYAHQSVSTHSGRNASDHRLRRI